MHEENTKHMVESNLVHRYLIDGDANNQRQALDRNPATQDDTEALKNAKVTLSKVFGKYTLHSNLLDELKGYKVFKDIATHGGGQSELEGLNSEEWERAYADHIKKTELYRGMKPWQAACLDDHEDHEADRIMAEVKNLEEEKQFYLYYQRRPNLAELERADDEQERLDRTQTQMEDALARTKT